jgi:RimJ/RimL family protein N-acetyltransferase
MPAIPGPAYCIETKRLLIRCWNPGDAMLLKAAIDESREHLLPWMPWAENEPTSLEEKIELLRKWRGNFDLRIDYIYGIFDRDEKRVLGGTGLHTRAGKNAREIGYWIHKDFINQGLATETASALTRVAFEVDAMERVEIHCAVENVRSAAVPRKLGYTMEATLRQRAMMSAGQVADRMIWTMLKDEYPRSPASRVDLCAFDAAGRRII